MSSLRAGQWIFSLVFTYGRLDLSLIVFIAHCTLLIKHLCITLLLNRCYTNKPGWLFMASKALILAHCFIFVFV